MELFPSAFTQSYIALATFLVDDYGTLLQIWEYEPVNPHLEPGGGNPFVSVNAQRQCHRFAASCLIDI